MNRVVGLRATQASPLKHATQASPLQHGCPLMRIALALTLLLGCRGESPPAAVVEPVPEQGSASGPPLEIDIPNARMPSESVLTGGQPTERQLEEAARAGYRTVVNLRTPGEQGAWDETWKAAELGLRHVVIPIAGADDLTVENARKLADIVDDPQALPAMVHCASGNRVGALFAVKAFHLDGENAERALAIGREAGVTRLEEAVKELLSPAAE